MKRLTYLLFFAFSFTFSLHAQEATSEKAAIIAPIKQLFEGMANKDTAVIKAVFHETATLSTTYTDKEGKSHLQQDDIARFITSIGSIPKDKTLEERILNYEVKFDDNLAIAWTPYEFYFDGKFSHCGVNAFQLFKTEKGWLITSICDTRRKEGCQ